MNRVIEWYRLVLAQSAVNGFPLFFLRVITGLALVQHGWSKIHTPFSWMPPDAPTPGFFQFLAAISEFGGGIALTLGLLTPLASFGIACTMAVAVFTHISQGAAWVGHGPTFELALLYFSVVVFFFCRGPGRVSVDYKFFK